MRTRKEYLKDLDNLDIPETHNSVVHEFVKSIIDDAEAAFCSIRDLGDIDSLSELPDLVEAIETAKQLAKDLY